jgi:CheY-like chemotaxis protein
MSLTQVTPPHLLVVEDDADVLSSVEALLGEEGYTVSPVTSLPASLALLQDRSFDFILTDLFAQPGREPWHSIAPLLSAATPIPVGVMTAWPIAPDVVTQAGLACLVRKPFEADALLQAVEGGLQSALSHKQQQMHVVELFFAALNARDWKRLVHLCTPEVTFVSLTAPAVADFGSQIGLFSYRTLMERRMNALPGYTFAEVYVFARPLGVAVRYMACWQSRNGTRHRGAGSAHLQFQGTRISQITGLF